MDLRIGRAALEPNFEMPIVEVGLVGLEEHSALFGPEIAGVHPHLLAPC